MKFGMFSISLKILQIVSNIIKQIFLIKLFVTMQYVIYVYLFLFLFLFLQHDNIFRIASIRILKVTQFINSRSTFIMQSHKITAS